MDWRHLAACRDVDPEVFFPLGSAEQAKTVCRSCPVAAECLVWALEHGATGVWGGTTEDERRAMRAQAVAR